MQKEPSNLEQESIKLDYKKDIKKEFNKQRMACKRLSAIGGHHDTNLAELEKGKHFNDNYFKWLPKNAKKEIRTIQETYTENDLIQNNKGYHSAGSVKTS